MKKKIDKRRHIDPMKCAGCGEEKVKGESNLIHSGMTDSVTCEAAYCSGCFKIRRISDVLANFVSPYDIQGNNFSTDEADEADEAEEQDRHREFVRGIIVERLCNNKELREYLGIDLNKEISVDALVSGEDDLVERVRHTKEWELKNE